MCIWPSCDREELFLYECVSQRQALTQKKLISNVVNIFDTITDFIMNIVNIM